MRSLQVHLSMTFVRFRGCPGSLQRKHLPMLNLREQNISHQCLGGPHKSLLQTCALEEAQNSRTPVTANLL